MTRPILIIGGTGVFGSRLARGLRRDGYGPIVIAGRNETRGRAIASEIECDFVRLDRTDGDFPIGVKDIAPRILIDAAGPFQTYGDDPYLLARMAIEMGAHYLDLSDDGDFTAGIEALNDTALQAGVTVLSGVSSVPAISSAAVSALSNDIADIDMIETTILPGNRAPRGKSVIRAILAQVGNPLSGMDEHGWVGVRRVTIETGNGPPLKRLSSPIGAPDLQLMPEHFNATEVQFHAGLELPIMHRGLAVIAALVRRGWLRSALPLARPLKTVASWLEAFGSDRGAMQVKIICRNADGTREQRLWTLIAEAGDGPNVPSLPARILVSLLEDGAVPAGARPCLSEFTLEAVETAAPELNLTFHRTSGPMTSTFQTCLGSDWAALPSEIQRLHTVHRRRRWVGRASVTRGKSLPARIIAALFRFPRESADTPVSVDMQRVDESEHWTRDFGGSKFRSVLTPDPERSGRMWERFGAFSFAIDLEASGRALRYPVSAGRFLGLPIPRWALPVSTASEQVDDQGRAAFDVALTMPLVGLVVRYRGWLEPA